MVRPISGQQRIQSGSEFTEDEGVTLRATRSASGAAHTRGAQGARSGEAHGTVRDEVVQTPRTTQTPGQAAVAARHAEIRSNANALLRQADATRPGPNLEIPAPRSGSGFQDLVNRQHDRAFRDGAINTGTALLGVAAGPLAHGLHRPAVEAVGIVISEGPHAVHFAQHPTVGGAVGLGLGTTAHIATAASTGHASGSVGGAAIAGGGIAGVSSMVHTMVAQLEDGDERRTFQQNASAYDARRATAITNANLALNHGVLDGHLAAAGRRPINWDMYRTNGDYASGVRRGLADGARNPGEVAHLTLQAPQEMRTSIP
jgi:hypothetical protein